MNGMELYGRVRYAVQIEGLSHRAADPRGANLLDPSFQAGLHAATRFVMIGGPIEFQDAARPPDRDC